MLDLILFIIPSWLLMGPPIPIFIAVIFAAFALLSALNHNSTCKTIFLLSMMSIMVVQCILFVFVIHFTSWIIPPPNQVVHEYWFLSILFTADLRLAELGAVAAACVATYLEFVSSRTDLSKAFPNLSFSKAPDDLTKMVEELAQAASIECPEVDLLDSGVPSAFTVRTRGHYAIAVSVGLLESFDASEIRAALAHEISHIKNRDFLVRSIVTVAKVAIFAKPLSYFTEAGVYRAREFLADRTAALLIGGAGPLISALTKLHEADREISDSRIGNLNCCFNGKRSRFWLLSKHPDLATRIRILKRIDLKVYP
ncbi:MAG: M48 family metalloprotease [Candidatus Bathyarchaeia archaeon]